LWEKERRVTGPAYPRQNERCQPRDGDVFFDEIECRVPDQRSIGKDPEAAGHSRYDLGNERVTVGVVAAL
jgi:hypothetical protein